MRLVEDAAVRVGRMCQSASSDVLLSYLHSGKDGFGTGIRSDVRESELDPMTSRSDLAVAQFSVQAERERSPIPRSGNQTCW